MENKQQTAVDYFFDKIKSNFEHDGDKLESVMFLYAICKEMEREQIINAYDGFPIDARNCQNGDEYYEQIYGTTKSS
jgi:hypothetical protein